LPVPADGSKLPEQTENLSLLTQLRACHPPWIGVDPDLDALQGDPRFAVVPAPRRSR
jgi:hypothetical protein